MPFLKPIQLTNCNGPKERWLNKVLHRLQKAQQGHESQQIFFDKSSVLFRKTAWKLLFHQFGFSFSLLVSTNARRKQRENSFHSLIWKIRIQYYAIWTHCDCLVFTPNDFDLHLKQLDQVLQKIDHANMRLKVEKCKFAFSEVPFLGHIVGREGLKMDPKKVQAISNIAYPTSKKEVRSFLGMAGYYRTFIPDFAGICKPLFDTLKDTHAEKFSASEEIKQAVDL